MWKILVSEFQYRRVTLSVFYLLCFLVPLTVFIAESDKKHGFDIIMPAVLFVMGTATLMVTVLHLMASAGAKQARLFSRIAVNPSGVALARILFGYSFWLLLCGTFWLVFGAIIRPGTFMTTHEQFTSNAFMDMLALNGFLLIINAAYLIARDMNFLFQAQVPFLKLRTGQILSIALSVGIFALILTIAIINSIHPLRSELLRMAVSPAGCTVLNTAGYFLAGLSIRTYSRRSSYLA